MESIATIPAAYRRKLEFAYDGQSRRIQKQVSNWDAVAEEWEPVSATKYVWSGWLMLAETNGALEPVRTYTWGTDLSGSLEGAGAVGGLLAMRQGNTTYSYVYDGNGNVNRLVDTATGAVAALYEYGPFGESLETWAEVEQPFRFSTKYQDELSGFYYYGYRFYNPETGRWLNRDPIGERGGVNLYAFVHNEPVTYSDPLGLSAAASESQLPACEITVCFRLDESANARREFSSAIIDAQMARFQALVDQCKGRCCCSSVQLKKQILDGALNDGSFDPSAKYAERSGQGRSLARNNKVFPESCQIKVVLTDRFIRSKDSDESVGPNNSNSGQVYMESRAGRTSSQHPLQPGSGIIVIGQGAGPNTLAHESGHFVGWFDKDPNARDRGQHSSDKDNLMRGGNLPPPSDELRPDGQWCDRACRYAKDGAKGL